MYKIIKKNKDNILVFATLLMVILPVCLILGFQINDELWNFSNIYKMSQGFEIYKDLNVIITPLFLYIGEALFKVFGANFLIFKIYGALICTIFYYLIYRIFCVLKVEKKFAITFMVMIFFPTMMIITQGANYNLLSIDFVLLGIILYIKNQDKRLKNNIIQGIMIYLVFMIKQNVAVFYVIGLIIFNFIKVIENKKQIKNRFLDLVSMAIIFIILVGTYVLYLYLNQNLYNAIDFAILGMGEFAKNLSGTAIYGIIVSLILDITFGILINNKKIKLSESIKNNFKILVSFAIPMLFIAFPLCNMYHAALAVIVSVIVILYFLEALFLKEILAEKNYDQTFKIGVILAITISFIILTIMNINSLQQCPYSYNHPYYGARVTEEQQKYLNTMCEYLNDNDAVIISQKSNFFMNVLLRSNGIFDLPFKGNLGKEGEQRLITQLENNRAQTVLIDNDKEFNKFGQDSQILRKYIQENYKKIGEIENFLIYQK